MSLIRQKKVTFLLFFFGFFLVWKQIRYLQQIQSQPQKGSLCLNRAMTDLPIIFFLCFPGKHTFIFHTSPLHKAAVYLELRVPSNDFMNHNPHFNTLPSPWLRSGRQEMEAVCMALLTCCGWKRWEEFLRSYLPPRAAWAELTCTGRTEEPCLLPGWPDTLQSWDLRKIGTQHSWTRWNLSLIDVQKGHFRKNLLGFPQMIVVTSLF